MLRARKASVRATVGACLLVGLGLLLPVAGASASTLGLSATDATIGQTIEATAQLSESPNAAGEITFEVFAPGDLTCSGPALTPAPDPAPVNGEGGYTSGEFTPAVAGTYRWSAHYTGDSENPPADSICSAVSTVAKASPGISGEASSGTVNTPIHDEVTVTGGSSPSGEVVFRVFAPADASCVTPLKTESVALQGGEASSGDFLPQQAGEFRWTAEYTGDQNNAAASLPCGSANQSSTVDKDSPGLSGVAGSAGVGTPITDTATLSGGFAPTGQLVFRAYGPGDASCAAAPAYEATVAVSGNGAYSPPGFAPVAGTYRWVVGYTGDGNNDPASLPCGSANQTSTVGKASPSLSGLASSAAVGSLITDSATLSGGVGAGGQLVFRAYGPGDADCSDTAAYEATVAVNGNGTYSPPGFAPPRGTYRWTVEYSGDANNEPADLSCGAANQTSTVSKASPALVGSASSGPVGAAITDSVTLSGGFAPGGQLVFRAYGSSDSTCAAAPVYEASVPVNGNGLYSPPGFAPPAGVYRWTVAYAGDADNEPSSLPCNSANQASAVSKAAPALSGIASSAAVGVPITDTVTLSGGFAAGGQLVFRAYGPGDPTCATPPKYEVLVPVSGNGSYSPAGFAPAAGLYRWTAHYSGDANNEAASLPCNSANQSSAVGTLDVILTASATSGAIGDAIGAAASLQEGAIPRGQITFTAYPPNDAGCSGAAAFSATAVVAGNGQYRSPAFVPTGPGTYRWVISYSGDPSHAPNTVPCGRTSSNVSPAKPSISSSVDPQQTVGTPFQIAATLRGGHAPTGKVTFRIYGPGPVDCAKPLAVNTVSISGSTARSDPFVAQRPGHYAFVASYSGDTANEGAAESCGPGVPLTKVNKRIPKVKPNARLKGNKISIRARLSGAVSPSGALKFRLFRPGDKRCKGKPAFSGGVTVKANGNYMLAQYLATKPGTYHLSVAYSGDPRNERYSGNCRSSQSILIG